MKIDPARQNYFTIKLWGSDVSTDRLILFVEGKQVGYHHLGDVDLLDDGDEDAPAYNGRFFYNTSPLPLAITKGKSELHCEIRSIGTIWGYGNSFEQYQKPMVEPTRGIYAVYTHTDGCFVPESEVQGAAPLDPPVRQSPGPEVLDKVKQRVSKEIEGELRSRMPLNEMQCQFLARAWFVQWSPAYHNPMVLRQIVAGLDALHEAWVKEPTLAEHDRATPNPGWFEFGPAGEAICLLVAPLDAALDQRIESDGEVRRAAWSKMLQAGRDYHVQHRRLYTNQSMITDLNICWSNRAIAAIDPVHALPKDQTTHYLYQSVGLEPWLGSETATGPAKPMGDHYFELTDRGLSKELGFVGYYGEVLDWVTKLYDSTRPTPDAPGDERIKSQLIKICKARSYFRFPAVDADGNRAMRIETIVGWRDAHHPGGVAYTERPSWDASALYAAAATLDPTLIGYTQQMFDDNQFFASLEDQLKTPGLRTTAGLLGVPDEYALLTGQPASPSRLPMSTGNANFAWADEQDGVVAIKHGDEIVYVSLYWRARQAINFLARVHDLRPAYERIAVVKEQTEFEASGRNYTRPDWIDIQYGHGGFKYPGDLHSAMAGEQLPIAKLPADDKNKPGEDDPNAGRGSFYTLRYGDYLIGMNSSSAGRYILHTPPEAQSAPDLLSGKTRDLSKPLTVEPQSTVVLWLGDAMWAGK